MRYDDILPFWCQIRSENSKNWDPGKFWAGEFKYDIDF